MSSAWDGLVNTRSKTELPFYAINKSLPEDTFFTKRHVAKTCYEILRRVCTQHKINTDGYTFLEPSAGEGCFYDLLPENRRIGLDIHPRANGIEKADFLTWYPQNQKKYVVVGNPPFGVRGSIALAFIKRALLFADLVAFILPMSFYSNGKGTNMRRVPRAQLLYNKEIQEKYAFYTPEHDNMSIQTVFQVWKKGIKKAIFDTYDTSAYADIFTVCSAPARRCGMDKLSEYDCYIASTFYGKIHTVENFDEVKYGSGYGLILRRNKVQIKQCLRNTDWTKYCTSATNHCKHIRMHHIKKCLFHHGFGKRME